MDSSSQAGPERERRGQEALDLLTDQATQVEECLGGGDLDLHAGVVEGLCGVGRDEEQAEPADVAMSCREIAFALGDVGVKLPVFLGLQLSDLRAGDPVGDAFHSAAPTTRTPGVLRTIHASGLFSRSSTESSPRSSR